MIVPVEIQMGYMCKNFPEEEGADDFYEGSLVIGKGRFWYTITVMNNDKIEKLGLKKGRLKDDRQAFKIELEKEKRNIIPLTDDEYFIFFGIMAQFQAVFWDKNTFKHAEELCKADSATIALMKKQCAAAGSPIIRTATAMASLYPRQVKLLNGPKFSCRLVGK